MSFTDLVKEAEARKKNKVRGGQTQGYVKTEEKVTSNRLTQSLGKGSEYSVKYKAEEDKTYFQSMAALNRETARLDVTSGEGPSEMLQPEELTSIGTLPNLRELNREDLTQVYANYNFTPVEPSEHLESIYNEREQILLLIESYQVCIIKGPTGCGKSTQIPQFILDSYQKQNAYCNIVVTQPRRLAAITIAQHVCEERKWDVGRIVGYQVALDKKISEDTRLLYCTTGVLLEKLINIGRLDGFTHIMLDEVHEREEDIDFLMLVIKKFIRSQPSNVKVVLMSATIDVSRFAKYFEAYLGNQMHPAPYYEIKRDNPFNVQVYYLDNLESLGNRPTIIEDEPGISIEGYQLIPKMLFAFNSIDDADYKLKRSHEEKGAVLIFLPGLHQIETLFDLLSEQMKMHPREFDLTLCPLHSSITRDEQEKVKQFAEPGKRKVILSTNIAESSLTIPDVKYVIDFCLTKHLVADPVTGFTSLQIAWASHTNCIQREGRVGRVQDGRVYRLVPRSFYQFKMANECLPEMRRCSLEVIVLKCKKLMENERPLNLIGSALDPPDLDNYEKTIVKLKEIGALLVTCRGKETVEDGDLTFIGRVMATLPLDIHVTKLILVGHAFGVLQEAIIMGCAMSVRNIFSAPFKRRLDAYKNKLLWADSSESDSVACLNAYSVWRHLTGLGKFDQVKDRERNENAWGSRYLLQIKQIKEMAKQEADIKRRLKCFNIQEIERKDKLWTKEEKPLVLKLVLAGAFYPHYFSRSAQNPNAESEAVKMLSGHCPYSCVYFQNMPQPAPLYLDQVREALRKSGVSDDVQFYHDSTRKLVVAFGGGKSSERYDDTVGNKNLHMDIPGQILMPVYRAIKLRQLNEPVTVKTLPQHQAREELNKLILRSRSSTLPVAMSEYKPQIGLHQQLIEIKISYVENAGHFYCHIMPVQDKLLHIFSILNKTNSLQLVTADLVDDMIYAAPYRDSDKEPYSYYRAMIKKKYNNEGDKLVKVFFIDYGNSSTIQASKLMEVVNEEKQEELDQIPPCVLECVLAEVCPSVWSDQGAGWADEATKYVKKTILNKEWFAKVYSYINGVASIYLYLSDIKKPSEKAHPTLNDDLVIRGYATHKEESYFSKVNHQKRMSIEEKGDYNTSLISADGDTSLATSLGTDLLSLPTTGGLALVSLKGPNSPLEMKLFSMVHCSCQKEVKVDHNSVNSVLLDSDPSDPHDRLLVAGSVSQSSDGRKLTLNHTTVLPNMHGLAALICLIFSPNVELRTNESFSRYTGALCGLGVNEKGTSLFPENDMEINFDVEITKEDLLNVNKLRYWINQRYCCDDTEEMSDSQVENIQNRIRHFTISLLKPLRKTIKVCQNSDPFTWGKIPKHQLTDPFPEARASDCSKFIYNLHKGIKIQPGNDHQEVKELLEKLKNLQISLQSGLTPRYIRCDLCDMDFTYCNQLRLHMTTMYHSRLVEWLTSRATIHELITNQEATE